MEKLQKEKWCLLNMSWRNISGETEKIQNNPIETGKDGS